MHSATSALLPDEKQCSESAALRHVEDAQIAGVAFLLDKIPRALPLRRRSLSAVSVLDTIHPVEDKMSDVVCEIADQRDLPSLLQTNRRILR